MDVIVEVHDQHELRRALGLGAVIIGINNRDLRTLKTDVVVTERLVAQIPADRIVISESGIGGRSDVLRLAPRVDAFLVGSSLMASPDIGDAARALVHGRIKICGVTRPDDAALAAHSGATHVGMIFADGSPRQLSAGAGAIADAARAGGARPVGVFQDQDFDFVAGTAKELGLAAVQLHGLERGLDKLRERLPEACEIWATCAVTNEVAAERADADRILYDTSRNGRSGGTGQAFDWSLVAGRPALPDAFVAGGISPANAHAAQQLGAYGIDLCSGVEESPGRKDPNKISALFEAVRPTCRRTN